MTKRRRASRLWMLTTRNVKPNAAAALKKNPRSFLLISPVPSSQTVMTQTPTNVPICSANHGHCRVALSKKSGCRGSIGPGGGSTRGGITGMPSRAISLRKTRSSSRVRGVGCFDAKSRMALILAASPSRDHDLPYLSTPILGTRGGASPAGRCWIRRTITSNATRDRWHPPHHRLCPPSQR
jgi:hypothetical protein